MTQKHINRRNTAQSGQAIVLIAFAMIVLLAFGVLAIDGSRFYDQRRTTQNAADMSALAGTQITFDPPTGVTANYLFIAKEIHRVAEQNGIPDSDGIAYNEYNTNVEAYWTDDTGNYVKAAGGSCASGTVPSTQNPTDYAQCARIWITGTAPYLSATTKPSNATGIMVRAKLPYRNFIGGLIGQQSEQAQADSVSKKIKTTIAWSDDTPGAINYDRVTVWLGGGSCPSGTPTFNVAATKNSNSVDLGGDVYISGSGGLGGGNSNQGLFKNNATGQAYFTGTNGDLEPADQITTSWTNPYASLTPAQTFPSYFYMTVDGAPHLLTAHDFNPDSSASDNYWYKMYVDQGSAPAGYFHSVPGSGPSNSADVNGNALKTAMQSGGVGVYYVDGNVNIKYEWGSGQALVATGKVVDSVGTGSSALGRADDPSGWGLGLSVFAGGSPANASAACTMSHSDPNFEPMFQTTGQQAYWQGIIFVPNGLASIESNSNGGHATGPVIANALQLGDGSNSNSFNLSPCPDCFDYHPPTVTYSTGLIH